MVRSVHADRRAGVAVRAAAGGPTPPCHTEKRMCCAGSSVSQQPYDARRNVIASDVISLLAGGEAHCVVLSAGEVGK